MESKLILCRNCKNKKLEKLFSLGSLSFTGKFAKNKKVNIPKAEISLVKCKNCSLVQLNKSFNPKYLYGKDYGYKSGINKTMTTHLTNTVKLLSKKSKLKKNEYVLDIASNDGTLLNQYKKGVIKVGIDPIINKFSKYYKSINYAINDFFSLKSIKRNKLKNEFKIITALAVFYDLKDPNSFLNDVKSLIDKKNGIFLLEFADLLSLIKYKLFDTICHEHLEYYSAKVIVNMVKNNGMKVFDIHTNDINGGSIRFFICNENANFKINKKNIEKYLTEEKKYKLEKKDTYKSFFREINIIKQKLIKIIDKIKSEGKTIHGYGASTKGNVLLQYFKINSIQMPFIADRNPEKNGLYTPSTKIKIISEQSSRNKKPDYYLVLPWHFKKEILKREEKIIKSGTKFIFPLSKIKINN
jgi:hypothetical protein